MITFTNTNNPPKKNPHCAFHIRNSRRPAMGSGAGRLQNDPFFFLLEKKKRALLLPSQKFRYNSIFPVTMDHGKGKKVTLEPLMTRMKPRGLCLAFCHVKKNFF